MSLMGTAKRLSAQRAYEIRLVSELTDPGGELAAAVRSAETIAPYPTAAVQGAVRAVRGAREAARVRAPGPLPDQGRVARGADPVGAGAARRDPFVSTEGPCLCPRRR